MEIQRCVGKNVRNARLAAGLSQWDLVARLEVRSHDHGMDQAYISQLENGRRNPTLTTLWLIAQALEVPLTQIVQSESKSDMAP
ncbi:helix-turn-helix domain-containing protein [Shinella sp. CPCC 101442]|nr:helix-turn-helix domain-containing protein [Shinella sp. CPCC 101442]